MVSPHVRRACSNDGDVLLVTRLLTFFPASLTSGHSLEANSGERICDDKANIETPPTSGTPVAAVIV